MGEIGSGRRFQSRRGPNLEEVPQLDVRVLKRQDGIKWSSWFRKR